MAKTEVTKERQYHGQRETDKKKDNIMAKDEVTKDR
jgi:hypothetical protein